MIDWKDVWSDAVAAAEGAVRARTPAAAAFVKQIAEARKRRLVKLLAALADGALDQEAFDAELAEERLILESELLAAKIMAKKAAQEAANALFAVIEKALLVGIRLPL